MTYYDENERVAIAQSPYSSREQLSQLASDSSPRVQRRLALNVNTPSEVLGYIARTAPGSSWVMEAIAQNINTPPKYLDSLSRHQYKHIRRIVASNSGTPANALEHLSKDDDIDVIRAVAHNPNTPEPVRFMLMLEHTVWTEGQS